MSAEVFHIGSLVLNAGTQEVTGDGVPIPLPPLSFNLLLALARHAPNVVSFRQLEQEVWSGLVVDRGTINKRALLVRNSLKEAGIAEEYIVVVRGSGYRLAVPVERLPDAEEAGDSPGNGKPAELSGRARMSRSFFATAATIALGLAVVVTWWVYEMGRARVEAASAELNDTTPIAADYRNTSASLRSIAVLPFEDQSDGFTDQYLADGIAQEVISVLSTMPEMRVASSSSSFTFRNSEEPPAVIAARLNVDSLVTGTVHRFGDSIHVMASLVDIPTGSTLWSESFDRDLNDMYRIKDDIAFGVATTLSVPLEDGARASTRGAPTTDVQAFTHFLKGRSNMDNRLNQGAEALVDALSEFQLAVEIDPYFVRAHVGLASVNFLLPVYDNALDSAMHMDRGEASARYALELDPQSSEALGVLAAIVARRGEPLQAAALFRRARELGNSDPNILHWHAMHFTSMGYFEDLVSVLDEAYRLDPLNPLLGCSLASALSLSGQPQESTRVLNGMVQFSIRDLGLAQSSLYTGNYDKAREMLQDLEIRTGVMPALWADRLVQAFEEPDQYSRVVEAFFAAGQDGELPAILAFEALLIMGSPRAFDLGVDLQGTPFEYNLPEPVWNNWGAQLRRDPRFKEWVRELGYDQYWREYGWPDRCRPTGLDDFECV